MSDDRKHRALEGKTFSEVWDEDPDPPPEYGRPDAQTIIEVVGSVCWVWHTANSDAELQFDSSPVKIKQ